LRHAIGIAEYYSPRSQMMRVIDHPTMLKDGCGFGAMARTSIAFFLAIPALTGPGWINAQTTMNFGYRPRLYVPRFDPHYIPPSRPYYRPPYRPYEVPRYEGGKSTTLPNKPGKSQPDISRYQGAKFWEYDPRLRN
jgi:hypothetical protein